VPHFSQAPFKELGAGIAALLLVFALAANSTTSNILFEAGSVEVESGIWLKRTTSGPNKEDDPQPQYCNEDTADGNCGDKDSDCCKARADKCKATQAFTVLATIGAAVALGGFVVPAAGIAGSALNAFCSLVSFSITASLMNGDSTDGGAFNKEADCGLKSDGVDISGGGAFGLQIVSFLLGIVGAACFFLAQRDSSA